jgi:hypothetical protein
MRRNNNIFYKDYEQQLDDAGVTPEDEIRDIQKEIKDMHGEFYEEFRRWLGIVLENLETKSPIKEGRKKIQFDTYMTNTICMPISHATEIERGYPIKMIPRGDGSYTVHKEFPDKVTEELKLLHWCYLELETAHARIVGKGSA